MNRKKFNNICVLITITLILLFVSSCGYDGDINDGNRDILIDVENSIFDSRDAEDLWEQGPGVTKIEFTIELDGGNGNISETFNAASIDTTYDYTQLTIPALGELKSISAVAYVDEEQKYSVVIADQSSSDEFSGWQVFANVTKFKIVFNGNTDNWDSGYIDMDICPRGTGVTYLTDSGVTSTPVTDWGGTALTSRQIAVEPVLQEHPANVTFDIYYLIVDEDLRALYKVGYGGEDSEYSHYQWADVWTYDEVTASGRAIGDSTSVYTLAQYNDTSLSFVEPEFDGCGYNSFLIDLSAEVDSDPVGKYLMYCLIMKHDTLEVISAMDIVEIK
jgi:hypothetical protein